MSSKCVFAIISTTIRDVVTVTLNQDLLIRHSCSTKTCSRAKVIFRSTLLKVIYFS